MSAPKALALLMALAALLIKGSSGITGQCAGSMRFITMLYTSESW